MGLAMSPGMLLGSAVYPKCASVVSHFRLMLAGFLGASAAYIFFAAIPYAQSAVLRAVFLAAVAGVFGLAVSFANTSVSVGFMTKADKGQIASISGFMNAACMASLPLGSFIVAAAANYAPVPALILFSGMASVLISASLLLIKPLREID